MSSIGKLGGVRDRVGELAPVAKQCECKACDPERGGGERVWKIQGHWLCRACHYHLMNEKGSPQDLRDPAWQALIKSPTWRADWKPTKEQVESWLAEQAAWVRAGVPA